MAESSLVSGLDELSRDTVIHAAERWTADSDAHFLDSQLTKALEAGELVEMEPLVESILAAVALLENSDDSEIDPDVAVQGMESMAHPLAKLGEDEAREFVTVVERVADRQTQPGAKEFYLSVPQLLGLVT